ncbi:Gfo/Idh/MocA family protein [Halosimplex salinum]|uniref:Gfo/Idh/MocA family protein n=1 Tax=Halosimplex salinum TaxID=1710538 RepID=UPI000F48CB62|nr:Gfo/Idh/MocA family oxidoreductase [Halosimplex salinum]
MAYDIAFIGTGPEPENPVWGESAAMAYRHAEGYREREDCEIVAAADIVRENVDAFATEFGIDADGVFEDYERMLDAVDPDIVSISTPVPTHADIVLDCIASGVPDAIHCEKPMATTWGDARLMAQEANRRDIQLTFNHQRRFSPVWREPKLALEEGRIGDLERIEVGTSTLLDNGTHHIDLAHMYAGESPVEWVIGQIDYREEYVKYGAHNENQGIVQWAYDSGVQGVAMTGFGSDGVGEGVRHRLHGTEGVIEITPWGNENVRVRRDGGDWETLVEDVEHAAAVPPAIDHVVDCLRDGVEPEFSARRALAVTEVIFAAWESARRRGRVDLPLRIDDNPLEAMVESGALTPEPADEG